MISTIRSAVVLFLLCGLVFTSHAVTAPVRSHAADVSSAEWPLVFAENQGQWPDSILYRVDAGAATMWITASGTYYQLTGRISELNPPTNATRTARTT